MQGLMQHHEQIAEYFRIHGVSLIFLFRRNLLRRMVSVLANEYDRNAKLLNGTHKSHVHSPKEVSIFLLCACVLVWVWMFMVEHLHEGFIVMQDAQVSWCIILLETVKDNYVTGFWLCFQAEILAKYKPTINSTLLIAQLKQVNETTTKALEYFKSTRHIILYYEDIVKNRTVGHTICYMIYA